MERIIFVFDSDQLLRRGFLVLLIVAYSVIGWGQPIEVGTPVELFNVRNDLSADYIQTADIDLSDYSTGGGWLPIGTSSNKFTGTYDGKGYTISNLYINRPSANYQGLFGYVSGATIQHLNLDNVNITGKQHLGTLAGRMDGGLTNEVNSNGLIESLNVNSTTFAYVGGLIGGTINGGTIQNSASYVEVSSTGRGVGGLVGINNSTSIINNSYSINRVSGSDYVGGLVGNNNNNSNIYNSYSKSRVLGIDFIGGLVGRNSLNSIIDYCYSVSEAIGNHQVGGLVGNNDGSFITNSFSIGYVRGNDDIGGLVGENSNSSIDNCYSSNRLTGRNRIGGFVGSNISSSEISASYSTGTITQTGLFNLGGFVGSNVNSTILGCYWDIDTSDQINSPMGTPKTTSQMVQEDTFDNWDFAEVWDIIEGSTYPFLQWQEDYADHNIPQIGRGLIYDGDAAKYNKTFSGWDAGELYVEFSPDAQDDGNAEINVTFTTYNLLSSVQEFPVPGNLSAYYSFRFAEGSVFENGNYLRLQLPNEPGQIWCKIDGSVWNPIQFSLIQGFLYEIQVQDISGLSRGDNVTIEFAADKGVGQTLPVELSSFTAIITTVGQVKLEWRVETETNMLGYDIYRSKEDGLSNAEKTNLSIIPAHNSSDGSDYVFIDVNVLPEYLYYYWLQSLDLDLTSNFYGPITVLVEDKTEPGIIIKPEIYTKLNEPYPNPFNPGTYITYSLSERTHVKIDVYNVKGQLIKSVLDQEISKGREHIVYWDGKDEMGVKVGSGVYFAVMKTNDVFYDTVKMILLK